MGSEKLCYLMHLQLEALNGQNLKINFARKLLPVAQKSKRIYIFLDKLAVFISAKLINLCFHCILALETTAPSITGAASSKTCCGKCRVQGSKHCGAGCWAVCRAPISQAMNAGGLLGYLPQMVKTMLFCMAFPYRDRTITSFSFITHPEVFTCFLWV